MDPRGNVVYHGATVVNSTPVHHQLPPYSGNTQAGYYPAPSAGPYGPPPPGMVTIAPAVIVSQQLGPRPLHMTCKFCHAEIISRVDQKATWRTHFFALGLCLVGCWPCAVIPYCVDDCMGAQHYCSNCNAYIGGYNI